MKNLLFIILTLGSYSVFAQHRIEAGDIIDLGNTVQVVDPIMVGCANGECYGGEGSYQLKARFSARRICRKLGYKKYVRGTKLIERIDGVFYDAFLYNVLYRSGPPGWPESEVKRGIKSLECYKKKK